MNEVPRDAILGLCAYNHDSSAALVLDGTVIGFSEEERLSGVKHTSAFPALSIKWLLDEAGIRPADITTVAYPFSARLFAAGAVRSAIAPAGTSARRYVARVESCHHVWRNCLRRLRLLRDLFPSASVIDVPHHLCHGIYAYACAGVDAAAVLTLDSIGEATSATIADVQHGRYRIVGRIRDPHSLGYAYGAVTEHLGYRRGDEEGTVMALAGLGDERRFAALLNHAIRLTRDGVILDPRLFAPRVFHSAWPRLTPSFVGATMPRRLPSDPVSQSHADLAAALQARIEVCVMHLGRIARQRSDAPVLCVAGGVAMNCLATGALVTSGLFERVCVPPAPADSGTAIGAALVAQLGRGAGMPSAIGPFMGPAFSREQVLKEVARRRIPFSIRQAPLEDLVKLLLAGQIVGLFRGRLEVGPRALGHRSIVASPLSPGVTERLNGRIKHRESFRPFAPVVVREHARRYFEFEGDSPYMSFAVRVRPSLRQSLPSIVHVNDTARVQTVSHESDAFFHELLTRFGEASGFPILINTSLNVKGKPMCGTPSIALDCFHDAQLDAILLEDVLIQR